MKKLISLVLALILTVTCLSTLSFAADPIAKIVTGDKTVEVATVPEITAAIDKSGNSVVTFLQDVEYLDGPVILPYSCTVDLGGYTLTTNPTMHNGFDINGVGTENKITTIKNGTVIYNYHGVRVNDGGIVLSNLTMHGLFAECVTLYIYSPDFNDANLIENCTLVCDEWGSFAFNEKDGDYSKVKVTVRDSNLISRKPSGVPLLDVGSGDCISGTVELGTGVNFYAYMTRTYSGEKVKLTGETVTMVEEKTASIEIPELNMKIEKLNKWSTPATPVPVAPVVPEVPAVPEAPVPTTGVSVMALGVMAAVSLAGAAIAKKR